MAQITIQDIFIYPIKALGGSTLKEATLEKKGFRRDRRWMLVDDNNQHLTQREFPQLALLSVNIEDDSVKINHKHNATLAISFDCKERQQPIHVKVWKDHCQAWEVNGKVSAWFSEYLKYDVKLVGQFENVDRGMATNFYTNDPVSFADEAPLLVVSQASLDDLNARMEAPLPINRFRPNLVISGCNAFDEDELKYLQGPQFKLEVLGKTARCMVTTINQDTNEQRREPLQTLGTYRRDGSKVYFGVHAYPLETGNIKVGEIAEIIFSTPAIK